MAADCKSAAPCELRRFESSPVHQFMNLERRFRISLTAFAALAIAIWFSMSGEGFPLHLQFRGEWVDIRISFRVVALIVLGLFAFKTVLYRKAEQIRDSGNKAGRE